MTEANIVMDENGDLFVPLDRRTNSTDPEPKFLRTSEESVDEPPRKSEHTVGKDTDKGNGLQSSSENETPFNTATGTEKILELLSNSKDANTKKGQSKSTQGETTAIEQNVKSKTPTESSSGEMKNQLENSYLALLDETQGQSQPMTSATKKEIQGQLPTEENVSDTPISSQNKSTMIPQMTTSIDNVQTGHGAAHSTVSQPESAETAHEENLPRTNSQLLTKKDQLFPLRHMQEDKDSKMMERLSHTQEEDLMASDKGEHKPQENAKEHVDERSTQKYAKEHVDERSTQNNSKDDIDERSTQKSKQPTTSKPQRKRDESKADIIAPYQMPRMEQNIKNQTPVKHEDVSSLSMEINSELAQLYPNLSFFQANVHPNQVSALLGAPKDTKSPQSPTGVSPEHLHESKMPAPAEHRNEKIVENSTESILNTTTASVSEEPTKRSNAETSTETPPQHSQNNRASELSYHNLSAVDGELTQTEMHSAGPFTANISPVKEQNTKPIGPTCSESLNFQDHLYEEADQIGLLEEPVLRQQLERLDHISLNIAVTGTTGAGKSTFINAIRGIDNGEENAAPTGVTETTMTAFPYPHPSMPHVTFWDLPGTGSPKFKAKKYLKEVKFEFYDFFVIISSERFKENDMLLATEILKMKKTFYFLRSKIDNDVHSEQCKKNFNEEKLLQRVREDCTNHLKSMVNPTVFLVSSFELNKYDFQRLVDTLWKDLPAHKRDALTLSLPIYSTEVLETKIKAFEKMALSAAKAASSISIAPIPGLAIACDAGILLTFFRKCYYAFGMDDKSLDKLSERVNNRLLKNLRDSRPLVMAIRQNELSARELSALASKRAALVVAYSLVPVWGSKRAANISHSATLGLLSEGLKELADTAREVLKVAKIDHIK